MTITSCTRLFTAPKHLAWLILVAALASCSQRPNSPVDVSNWGLIVIGIDANPTNDFQHAIATNDTRLVAYGYKIGGPLPGYIIPVAQGDESKQYGVKVIAGTGGQGPNAFPHDVASKYATAYNQLLLQTLRAEKTK